MKKDLPISEWHRLAEKGQAPPVRITLNGGSMHPLIRWNRDFVTVVPLQEEPVAGDIILFSGKGMGRFVIHRVWEVQNGKVLIWGDNCTSPDGWFPLSAVWGKVVLIERGKRKIFPDSQRGIKWAKFWHRIRPGYLLYRRIKEGIVRRIKKWKCEVFGENRS